MSVVPRWDRARASAVADRIGSGLDARALHCAIALCRRTRRGRMLSPETPRDSGSVERSPAEARPYRVRVGARACTVVSSHYDLPPPTCAARSGRRFRLAAGGHVTAHTRETIYTPVMRLRSPGAPPTEPPRAPPGPTVPESSGGRDLSRKCARAFITFTSVESRLLL
jgi:hypothetical protein